MIVMDGGEMIEFWRRYINPFLIYILMKRTCSEKMRVQRVL